MITGQEFEVNRRVYVDFEGISLRRKFLTGLEPELINVMIGNDIIIVIAFLFDQLLLGI